MLICKLIFTTQKIENGWIRHCVELITTIRVRAITVNPLNGRGVNWLDFAIQV